MRFGRVIVGVAACSMVVALEAAAGPAAKCSKASPSTECAKGGAPDGRVKVVQFNVGNVAAECKDVKYKLCKNDVEDAVRKKLSDENADILFLTEVLPSSACTKYRETLRGLVKSRQVCRPGTPCPPVEEVVDRLLADHACGRQGDQIRRLVDVGPGPNQYTVVCNSWGEDCIAIRNRLIPKQGFNKDGDPCQASDRDCCKPGQVCGEPFMKGLGKDWNGFDVSSVVIDMPCIGKQRLVNAHPPSGKRWGDRKEAFEAMCEMIESTPGVPVLIGGDLNMDPRQKDPLVPLLNDAKALDACARRIGLQLHSDARSSHDVLRHVDGSKGSWDHVLSNGASSDSTCVRSRVPGAGDLRLDHLPQTCKLRLEACPESGGIAGGASGGRTLTP